MKKLSFLHVVFILGLIVICFYKAPSLQASAVQLSVSTQYVSYDSNPDYLISNQYNYRVTLYISDADDVSSGGFATYFDFSNFEVISKPNNPLEPYIDIYAPVLISTLINTAESLVGAGFLSDSTTHPFARDYNDPTDTGVYPIYSFYVYSKDKNAIDADPTIAQHIVTGVDVIGITNTQAQSYPDTELVQMTPTEEIVIHYTFMLGDVNGDGVINLTDAQLLNSFVTQHPDCSVTVVFSADSVTQYAGIIFNTSEFGEIVDLNVLDANHDGVIDSTDATLVLTYYIDEFIGSGHSADEIIGTIQDVYLTVIIPPEN